MYTCTYYVIHNNMQMCLSPVLPVDGVDGEPGAEKAAITAVTFVGKWIASRRAAHHVVQVENVPLRSASTAPAPAAVTFPPGLDQGHGRHHLVRSRRPLAPHAHPVAGRFVHG